MAKVRSGQPRSLSLVPGTGSGSVPRDEHRLITADSDGGELVLGRRRYRLVPVEDAPAPASTADAGPAQLLTARELQIVALVAEGRVNKQIANDLRISEWTVSTHLRRVFAKLGVDTRAAMVSRCLRVLSAPDASASP